MAYGSSSSANSVVLQANNPEQEEAVETLEVEYAGDAMEIGFNVNYLLDALAAVPSEQVEFGVHGCEFELPDPRAGSKQDEVRRDADAPVGAASAFATVGAAPGTRRDLRCLAEVELDLDPARNYIFGPNGAGKTSLLEAIFLLGRGDPFEPDKSGR